MTTENIQDNVEEGLPYAGISINDIIISAEGMRFLVISHGSKNETVISKDEAGTEQILTKTLTGIHTVSLDGKTGHFLTPAQLYGATVNRFGSHYPVNLS